MKLKQQIPYALLTAIIAFIITYITQAMWGWPYTQDALNPLTYITFATWACYFAAGCTVKGALNWLYSMIVGIIAAILMFILTFALCGCMDYLIAVSLAVLVIVFLMMFYDKIKINGAALFIGTAIFFSLHAAKGVDGAMSTYMLVAGTEILYTVFGLICGWLTIAAFGLCMKIGAKD